MQEELKFSATGDMTKDQRRPIKVKVYRIKCPANGKDYDFIPDFPQILKSFEGRNKDMDNAAREVVLRSFEQEIRRLMDCKGRQNSGTQIPLIVEYDGVFRMPQISELALSDTFYFQTGNHCLKCSINTSRELQILRSTRYGAEFL